MSQHYNIIYKYNNIMIIYFLYRKEDRISHVAAYSDWCDDVRGQGQGSMANMSVMLSILISSWRLVLMVLTLLGLRRDCKIRSPARRLTWSPSARARPPRSTCCGCGWPSGRVWPVCSRAGRRRSDLWADQSRLAWTR